MSDRISEQELGRRVRTYLDRGVEDLRPGVAYRLQAARDRALQRLAAGEPATAVSAHADGTATWFGGTGLGFLRSARFWLAVAVLLVGLATGKYWQDVQVVRELEEIDAALLSGDLPIDAFIDKGFQNWLRRGDQP
jgi:hypothetical protein